MISAILNLTGKPATAAQREAGVIDLSPEDTDRLVGLLKLKVGGFDGIGTTGARLRTTVVQTQAERIISSWVQPQALRQATALLREQWDAGANGQPGIHNSPDGWLLEPMLAVVEASRVHCLIGDGDVPLVAELVRELKAQGQVPVYSLDDADGIHYGFIEL
jgi:hypothetical protein